MTPHSNGLAPGSDPTSTNALPNATAPSRPWRIPLSTVLGAAILSSAPALFAAQDPATFLFTDLHRSAPVPQSGPACIGGVAGDDGTVEEGYRVAAPDIRLVQRLTPTSYPSTLSRVCVCWLSGTDPSSMSFNFIVYDDDGPGGFPGSFLGTVPGTVEIGTEFTSKFVGQDCTTLGLHITSGGPYVGVQWNGVANEDLFICADESAGTTLAQDFRSVDGAATWTPLTDNFQAVRALMIRAEFTPDSAPDPEPPAGAWLTTTALPGFQFKSRIDNTRIATKVNDCVPETLCLAGAISSRTEAFVRIIGPRPNGFLWPEVIRFTTSRVELWVQKTAGGPINYYDLAAVPQNSDVLNGLVDRQGFLP